MRRLPTVAARSAPLAAAAAGCRLPSVQGVWVRWRTETAMDYGDPCSLLSTTRKIMNTSYANMPHAGATGHTFHPGGKPVGNDEYGTLIFDLSGRICGSGSAADNLFGAARGRITGRMISVFIPDIQLDGGSHGHDASSVAWLCETGQWEKFEAMDVLGRGFAVEIRVSPRMTDGQKVFVLDFFRPGEAMFSRLASP